MRTREFAVRLAIVGLLAAVVGVAGCSDRDERTAAPPATPSPRADPAQVDWAMDSATGGWLPTHQCPDGHWSAEEADRWVRGVKGPANDEPVRGKATNDIAVTALAALVYLGAGYTPRHEGTRGSTVGWAIRWLSTRQGPDGSLVRRGERLWATNHALATRALVLAATLVDDAALRDRARRAMAFAASSLRQGDPAWREEVGPGRLPPIAWLLAVPLHDRPTATSGGPPKKAAKWRPTLAVEDEATLASAEREMAGWINKPGVGEGALARTAIGIIASLLTGVMKVEDPSVVEAANQCAASPPSWDVAAGTVDLGFWLVGTEALDMVQGAAWSKWNKAVETAVSDTERTDGDSCAMKRSWDPHGPWADEGGRVFSTSAGELICEIYYRYDEVLGAAPDRSPTARPPAPRPLPPEPPPRVYAPCR